MRFMNCTPHDINIYNEEDTNFIPDLRKALVNDGAVPIETIPKSEILLNAQMGNVELPIHYKEANPGFLVGAKIFTGVDTIPADVNEETIIIVSAIYYSARQSLGLPVNNLATVSKPVYGFDGKTPVGCLELAVGA